MAKKKILIITDESTATAKMAGEIAAALNDNKVSVMPASKFKGNDILPADVFFLGCEKPRPDCFTYLADLLKHINLSGRSCGVFSSGSEKTAVYLAGLLKNCEASLNSKPLLGSGAGTKKWAQSVLSLTGG